MNQYSNILCLLFISTILFCGILALPVLSDWESQIVFLGVNGKLFYIQDSKGNRIPDFSYAGYKNGEQPIPDIPVIKSIEPISGDNTAHIQQAIDEVGSMDPDSNGFRGSLLLKTGEYEIQGTIYLNHSGIILRGEGDGDDPSLNTILKATGNSPPQRTVLIAGGGLETKWADMVPGSVVDIVTDTVFVGERSFDVADASGYSVGDNIIIYHPCTESWLSAVNYGDTFEDPWEVDDFPISYNRYITKIEENRITIDAQVYNHLVRAQSQAFIYRYGRYGVRKHVGIENLRINIETFAPDDENHAWNAIDLLLIEDSWVRNCTFLHFGLSGIRTKTASRVTVVNCRAVDPVAIITGARMYNFNLHEASQFILIKECFASNGRHHYVSNGCSSVSGCVFLDCKSSGAWNPSEGHRKWSQGLLYDNHVELDGPISDFTNTLLGLYNRGNFGNGHGWGTVHSVAWACDVAAGDLILQQPPTGQNYAIGCFGNITGKIPPAFFPCPEGYIEGSNQPDLVPRSLYLAQLEDRIGPATDIKLNTILTFSSEYRLHQNFPNPFNSSTTIEFTLPKSEFVELKVYNVLGKVISTFVYAKLNQGKHSYTFDGSNLASGIYYYQLQAGVYREVKKMILLR